MGYEIEELHGSYNRVARTQAVRYIVVHYTGSGTSKPGSARANCVYFSGGNRNASAHYFIDDGHIYEYADPSRWVCWHVGDGHGRYGITNANSVGIEVCNDGGEYTAEEKARLRWLVLRLMDRFGVPASRVVRHYDASRKCCPAPYAPNGEDPTGARWAALHEYITGNDAQTDEEDEVTDEDIQRIARACAEYVYGDDEAQNRNMYNAAHRAYDIEDAVSGLSEAVGSKATSVLITPTHDGEPLGYIAWWDGNRLHGLDQQDQPTAVQKVYGAMGQEVPSVYVEDNWFYRFATAVGCSDEYIAQKVREYFPDEGR